MTSILRRDPEGLQRRRDILGSPSRRNPLLIWGGIAGAVGVLAYGSTQAVPPLADVLHSFPVENTLLVKAAGFWINALWPVLSLFMVYVLYRVLAERGTGHAAFLGFVSGVVAFPVVVMHNMIQSGVQLEVSDLARSDPTFSTETWNSVAAAVHGVDNGVDLAWDVFLVLWLVLSGFAMLRHSRFGMWWGVPAIVIGSLTLVLNAITVPEPPASAGLFDAGPLVGLYALTVSVYLVILGLSNKPPREETALERVDQERSAPSMSEGKE